MPSPWAFITEFIVQAFLFGLPLGTWFSSKIWDYGILNTKNEYLLHTNLTKSMLYYLFRGPSHGTWTGIGVEMLESGLGCSLVVEVRLDPTELKFGCQTERTDQPNFNNEFSLFFLTVTPAKNESKKKKVKKILFTRAMKFQRTSEHERP